MPLIHPGGQADLFQSVIVMGIMLDKKLILSLLLISSVLAVLSLYQREIGTDDAWFAEQSYWFAKKGHVRSELFYGLNQFQDRHLAYHRLHVWQGALAYHLFGWSAYVFKSIMLVYLAIFLLASYLFIKRYQIFTNRREYYLFYTFVFSYSIMVFLFFTNRPDITIMTFGFLSFCLLYSDIQRGALFKPVLAGAFAGLAVLTHLNGLVFMVAGAVILLMARQYRSFWFFSVAGTLVSMLYFIIINDMADLHLYLQQMKNNPALSEKDFSIWGSILKLLSAYKAYFHKGSDASYTLLFVAVFWWQRRRIFADETLRIIFIYFITIAITLAMISPGFKSLYLVYHAPYAFLLLAILYKHVFEQSAGVQRTFVVLLSLYFLTQWGEITLLINKRTPGMAAMHANVSQSLGLHKGDRIVAPIVFVFNEMDKYTIQSFYLYRALAGQRLFELTKDFFRVASEDKRKYLILTDHHLRDLKITGAQKGARFGRYTYLGRYGPYHGFRLVN